jgi:hypothetical protein
MSELLQTLVSVEAATTPTYVVALRWADPLSKGSQQMFKSFLLSGINSEFE